MVLWKRLVTAKSTGKVPTTLPKMKSCFEYLQPFQYFFFASKSIITWNQLATFKSWSSYPQFVLALASKARMALVINHKEGQVANKKTSNAMIGARGLCV